MKKITLLLIGVLVCVGLSAQRTLKLKLSDDGLAELTVFLPSADKATGKAVVCCPGGGYSILCMSYEGVDWAPYYNDMGIAYAVLKYRMPHGDRTIPVTDACRAMQTMRDSAAVWHINPNDVGIMGFSAGGHLASTIATSAPMSVRPNFQILFYPVISMDPKLGHRGSSKAFLGQDIDNKKVIDEFSSEKQVRRHLTPPAIIFAADNDREVDPFKNSVAYYTALRRKDVAASMHVYPIGGHGWRFDNRFPYHEAMLKTLSLWLESLKAPDADAVRVACVGNSITDGAGIQQADIYGYPAQLGKLLGNGYNVKNFGVSGRTLLNSGNLPYMKEKAWQDSKDFLPQIVIIKLGTNDSKTKNWEHKDEFARDMQQMISELKSLPSTPKIYLGLPAKAWKGSWTINDSVIVNEVIPIIRKVAKKNRLEVIDFYTPLSADEKLTQTDGIHPNEKGVKLMAEEAAKVVRRKK